MSFKPRLSGGMVLLAMLLCAGWLAVARSNAADVPNGGLAEAGESGARRIRVLFLGDNGHHRPYDRASQIIAPLGDRGVDLFYTENLNDLNPRTLADYDVLLIYANHTQISSSQEAALLQFVESGKGLAAIHCASYCFHNSDAYINLVGAQFRSHGTGVFATTFVDSDHPVLKDVPVIESWDETYVHHRHNEDRTVLSYRVEGDHREPWTWVRTHGKGRVFYTAWGHDQRTWGNPAFGKLLENGIRWSAGDWALAGPPKLKPFEYVEANVPNYLANAQWGTTGEPIRRMQKPLGAEESAKHLVLRPRFRAELFAAEPDIVNPIAMAWDERGRLWIAETVDYPNSMQQPGLGNDRIKICEDTDGDGRADRFTIFAAELSIPTGMTFAGGGLIVSQAPDMLFLQDTDGDDVADVRKVLFTGFGTRDTHAGPSNLRYGFDNWVWATVGYSGFSGSVGGKNYRFGQGVFRFRPDGSAMEFIGSTSNNTWGLGQDETGEMLISTANNDHSVHAAIPNRYFEAVRGWHGSGVSGIAAMQFFHPVTQKVRQVDWHGKFTAAAGHSLYTARQFPAEYWNRVAFVNEPTGHLVHRVILDRAGSGFVASDGWNMLASDDEWTSPILSEVGPDGSLWVVDWYNFIVQHNPTPPGFGTGKGNAYETPLRDKEHARIYRVVYEGADLSVQPKLDAKEPGSLVAALGRDNLFWRLTAQHLLVQRGGYDVIAPLTALVEDTTTDAIGSNPAAIHALWTLEGLGLTDGKTPAVNAAITKALKHPIATVRKTAAAVAPRTSEFADAIIAAGLHNDADAFVRRQALLAMSEMPASDAAGRAMLAVLRNPSNAGDRWIPVAATTAAARHAGGFLAYALRESQAAETRAEKPKNLITNPSMMQVKGQTAVGWRSMTHSGRGAFSIAEIGRTDNRSLRIDSDRGGDISWSTDVDVQPQTDYELSGWVRTESLRPNTGRGAQFNVHQIQGENNARTEAIGGNQEWTRLAIRFNSGQNRRLTINCLFGGWGQSVGTAWFDDVQLMQIAGASTGLGESVDRAVRVVTTHVATGGDSQAVGALLASLHEAGEGLGNAVLEGLVEGWPRGTDAAFSESVLASITGAFDRMPASQQLRLLQFSDRAGVSESFASKRGGVLQGLEDRLADEGAELADRVEAAGWLVRLQDGSAASAAVLSQVTPQHAPEHNIALVNVLSQSRQAETGHAMVAKLPSLSPAVRTAAIAVLLQRSDWTLGLLEQIEKNVIGRSELSAQQWHQLSQSRNPALASAAERLRGMGSSSGDALVQQFAEAATLKGDKANGKTLYIANCMVCHEHNGMGGKVGPSLTGIGARPREEVLIAVLDPNRSVEANYQLWTVEKKDGQIISGRMDVETQTTVELLDLAGNKHTVQRADIKSMTSAAVSIMPPGFERLGKQGLADLMEYMAEHEPAKE